MKASLSKQSNQYKISKKSMFLPLTPDTEINLHFLIEIKFVSISISGKKLKACFIDNKKMFT